MSLHPNSFNNIHVFFNFVNFFQVSNQIAFSSIGSFTKITIMSDVVMLSFCMGFQIAIFAEFNSADSAFKSFDSFMYCRQMFFQITFQISGELTVFLLTSEFSFLHSQN